MASVALGVVGFAIGGPFGAQIGMAIGGIADSFLFSSNSKVQGPRLSDLSVTSSAYGQQIPLVYGPKNRLAGNLVWSSGLIETEHTESQSAKGGPSVEQTTYTYSESFAIAFSDREATGVVKRIWANSKLIFDYYNGTGIAAPTSSVGMIATRDNNTHTVFDTLRFYRGNGTQQIDPTIESYVGVGQTQAYRHTVYIVIKDLELADFGNVHPNIEIELEADTEVSVAEIVLDICNRSDVGVVSTSHLVSLVDGYTVSRSGSAFSAIQPLSMAYHFDCAEQFGQLRFVPRGSGLKQTIGAPQLGAAPPGGKRPDPLKLIRSNDTELPKEVTVSYRDENLDYQINSQVAKRQFGNSESNISIELALTLTADGARQIADRVLWGAWASRRSAEVTTSDRNARRSPGDMFGLEVAGNILPFKLTRAQRGANGVINWALQYEDPEVYSSEAYGAPGNITPSVVQYPGDTVFQPMDAPLLKPNDDNTGFYWVANGPSDGWRGANILRSSDGGITYNFLSQVGLRAITGTVASALASGPTDFFDYSNTLTVVLDRSTHELPSISELEVLNGGNAFWLGPPHGEGGEVIQYASATLVSAGVYELEGLLRGRRGTEYAVSNHVTGEKFVFLSTRSLGRTDLGAGDWDRIRKYKPVSILTTEADTPPQDFRNTGEAKRPLSPVHPSGSRDGSNNLTITWVRRTRLYGPSLGGGPVPLGEESEAYEIDILIGSGTPARTITAASETATYTAAEQSADGITPGDPVMLEIYQMSAIRGRGRACYATL